jgi:transcriptional regulator with XRE-family HTH domain
MQNEIRSKPMAANGAVPDRVPLSVLLFHAAMTNDKSISEYAEQLQIGAISLRQFIEGNTQRPRQKTLELIGSALDMTVDEVRQRMGIAPEVAPPFGNWLEQHMKQADYSRARITRETKISDGALRNYLADRTMPDSDQAQRLAEVLGAEPLEVARVIVANTVAKNGGVLAEAAPEGDAGVELGSVDGGAGEPGGLDGALALATPGGPDEATLLVLWRQLHPQGRRATFSYIAMLLAER